MAQAAALLAARFLPNREIIDYASAGKTDAPSGTARELAERLATVNTTTLDVPVEETGGRVEARGATVAGTQVHSLRLPSFVVSTEVVFALPDERLVIRHDAGSTPTPYVAGTLLAIRASVGRTGLVRGLDTLLLDR
ncbi:MAG: dihydrodipicolinate reductase C-terminal domain-containing protein [Actinomycetes bacterium]